MFLFKRRPRHFLILVLWPLTPELALNIYACALLLLLEILVSYCHHLLSPLLWPHLIVWLLVEFLINHRHAMALGHFVQRLAAGRINLDLRGCWSFLLNGSGLKDPFLFQFFVVFHCWGFDFTQFWNEIGADVPDDLGELVLFVIVFSLISVRLRWLESVELLRRVQRLIFQMIGLKLDDGPLPVDLHLHRRVIQRHHPMSSSHRGPLIFTKVHRRHAQFSAPLRHLQIRPLYFSFRRPILVQEQIIVSVFLWFLVSTSSFLKAASLFVHESGTIFFAVTYFWHNDERGLEDALVLEVLDSFQVRRRRRHVVRRIIPVTDRRVLVWTWAQ